MGGVLNFPLIALNINNATVNFINIYLGQESRLKRILKLF